MSFEKALYVTDKGAAAAIVLGVTFDQLENYISKFASKNVSAANSVSYFKRFKWLYKVPPKREFLVRKTMEYLLNNNCFNSLGTVIYPSRREFKKGVRYIQDEFNEAFGDTCTVKEFLQNSIEKHFLKEAFQEDRKSIDLVLRQLET